MANDIQESINNAIDIIVGKRIDALALDKTVIGIVDSIVSPTLGIHKIKYDGGYFNAESQSGAIFQKGMSVYVQIPQNDMTKKKLILGRASNLRTSERTDALISNLNNYAIIGNSIVSPKNESVGEGIRSYHNENEENEEHPITHRAKLIYSKEEPSNTHYQLNLGALDLYKENATALMIQAEFRTSFDAAQRYNGSGVYGIGLNLSFENSNYQYGSTQGEMFDYFASQIQGEVEKPDNSKIEISMHEIDNKIQEAIQEATETEEIEDLIKDDGILDAYMAYGNALLFAYAMASPAIYIQEEDAIMRSYLAMLSDLKNLTNTISELQNSYLEWRNLEVGKPSKQVSYVLDSNMMVGNPFSFTSWSTQYAIFNIDLEHFESIDSILFYKQGFNWNKEKEEERGEDIFIRNLKIYVLQPISAVNGEYRLEIQSPDGLIFETLSEEEKLNIIGKTIKSYNEDLSDSDKVEYYWFKKNPNVTNVNHELYQQYGGIGWEYIGGPKKKGNTKNIKIYGNENTAYKNKYKCVSLVDDIVILKDEFILYNNAVGTDVDINSNLGRNFSFDAGEPVLTCLLKLKDKNSYEEYLSDDYSYTWSMTVDNITTSFEHNYLDSLESISWDETTGTYIKKQQAATISSIMQSTMSSAEGNILNVIQGVQFFNGEELITSNDDIPKATRIKYPISNLAEESVITFSCHVMRRKTGEEEGEEDSYIDIGEATIELQNQGHPQISSYRLVLENGDQIFQYDEYGNPPNSPKLKSPLEIKPVIPHLLNPAGIEVANKNYKVQWTLPIEDTLIIPDATLGLNPFDNGKISLDSSPQCAFKIAESYNENKLNNQILCRVTINEEVIQAITDFYFCKVGSNGTNGTDMVAKIVPVENKQILNSQPIILYRYNDGKNIIFNTGTINGAEVFLANSDSSKIQIFKAKLYQKNEEISEDDFTVRWNIAGNPQATANKISRYINVSSHLNDDSKWISSLQWDESFNKPDDENPDTYIKYQPIYTIRAQITYQEKDYYAFYSFPVIYYNSATIPIYNRIAINKSTLLKEIVYNADGRNPIYNHNQGVEIINVPKDAIVSWYAYGGKNGDGSTADFKLLRERNGKKKNAVLSVVPESVEESQNFIYILPNDNYDGSHTNNRIVAVITKNDADHTEIATVTMPLHMFLNTFGLASLNAWDGNTVTIDEDGGYVMAPQVGAGEKDSNNRFTGILMGKTETYTGASSNEVETGLFGYAHGLQSIFLDSNTGEAYFGLPDGKVLDKTGNIPIPKDGDNYNEGRVELIPGGVSKIGGWHLGHRSLYYAMDKNGNIQNIGSKYNNDYTPNAKGEIKWNRKQPYSAHHEKDIQEDYSGILLHAGENPYISIKGKQLSIEEDGLSQSAESYLLDGDSLELQLDPRTPTLFTIFRHNGQDRYKDPEKTQVLYPEGSRTYLAGINGRGELVANSLQSVTQPTGTTTGDSVTTFKINMLPAFGETIENASHIGFKTEVGDFTISKLFIKKDGTSSDPLYLTGATSASNEYERPISIHGKNINLYASSDKSINKTTNSKIVLDNTKLEAGNFNTSFLKLYTKASNTNTLQTVGNLNISTTTTETYKDANDKIRRYGTITISAGPEPDGDNKKKRSYLTLENDGNVGLRSANTLTGTSYNNMSMIVRDSQESPLSQLTLTSVATGTSKLESVGVLNLNAKGSNLNLTAAAELIAKAGSNISFSAGGQSIGKTGAGLLIRNAAPEDNDKLNSFLKVPDLLNISGISGLNFETAGLISLSSTYGENADGGDNIFHVSTGRGSISLQKNKSNSGRNCDVELILSSNDEYKVGLYAPYGYFNGEYNSDLTIYSSKGISASNYLTRSNSNDGAYKYAFNRNSRVTYSQDSSWYVTGGSVGALFEGTLERIKILRDNIQGLITALTGRVATLETDVATLKTTVSTLSNHTHEIDVSNAHAYVINSLDIGLVSIDGEPVVNKIVPEKRWVYALPQNAATIKTSTPK